MSAQPTPIPFPHPAPAPVVKRSRRRVVLLALIIALDSARDLPVNTSVSVVVEVRKHEHVLTLPREALHGAAGAQFVYRVADGRLVRTPVEIGLANAMRAEITAGLGPEDTIALRATENQALRNKARVEIENSR